MALNVSLVQGRLANDLKAFPAKNGSQGVNFTLMNEPDYNPNNEKAQPIDCVAFGKTAENMLNYKHKGDDVTVEGEIDVRQDKQELVNPKTNKSFHPYRTSILVHKVHFGQSAKANLNQAPAQQGQATTLAAGTTAPNPDAPVGGMTADDLPF